MEKMKMVKKSLITHETQKYVQGVESYELKVFKNAKH